MKIRNLWLLIFILGTTIGWTQNNSLNFESKPRFEIGLNVLPTLVNIAGYNSGFTELEILLVKRTRKKVNFKIRGLINTRGILYENNEVFRDVQNTINPDQVRQIEHRFEQRTNFGVQLGFEKVVSSGKFDYYYGIEVSNLFYRGRVNATSNLIDIESEEGSFEERQIISFLNYELGIIPIVGFSFDVDNNLKIRLELGPKIGFFYESTPMLSIDKERFVIRRYQNSSDLRIINNLTVTYKIW